jgi:hypothetical protein
VRSNSNVRPSLVALVVIAIFCLPAPAWPQAQEDRLASKRYADPKGYFRIVPPDGWRVQEYPEDARGKVAFTAPQPNTDLRILINAVDFTTTDDLVKSLKSIEARAGLSTNIVRTDFGGRPAVKRSFEARGLRFLVIDFLVGSVDHNIQFAAPPSQFQKYMPVVTKSIQTYEALSRTLSASEANEHVVAKMRRLGQLMIDNGTYDLALEYINEGLKAAPQDAKLRALKQEAETRRTRR